MAPGSARRGDEALLPGLRPERRDDHRDEESGEQEHDRRAQADPEPDPVRPTGSRRERVERRDAAAERISPVGGGSPLDALTAAIPAGILAGFEAGILAGILAVSWL